MHGIMRETRFYRCVHHVMYGIHSYFIIRSRGDFYRKKLYFVTDTRIECSILMEVLDPVR